MPTTAPIKTPTTQATFDSNFSSGKLDTTKWIASSYSAANYGGRERA
jgi:hypothetical protein